MSFLNSVKGAVSGVVSRATGMGSCSIPGMGCSCQSKGMGNVTVIGNGVGLDSVTGMQVPVAANLVPGTDAAAGITFAGATPSTSTFRLEYSTPWTR